MSQNYIPQKIIQTKPYITVSAKGISNDLSNTFNDGADFGPDTLLNATSPSQYGPPFSNTSGIQEALNYAAQISAPVQLGSGTFPVSTAILLPAVGNGLFLRGASEHFTTIEQASGYTGPIMQWANTTTPNAMYYFGHFRLYGPNGGGGSVWLMDLLQNEVAVAGMLEQIRIVHKNVGALRLDGNEDTITVKMNIDNGGTGIPGVSWTIPRGAAMDVGSEFISGGFVHAQLFNFVGSVFGGDQIMNLFPTGVNATYNFHGCYWNNPTPPQIYVYPAGGSTNTISLNFIGCMVNPSGLPLANPFFYNPLSSTVTLYAKFIDTLIQSSSAVNLFGSNINGYAEFDDLTQPLINVNVNNASVSTPTVPSSGTAQQNSNPFPVTVYLSGGSATLVQVEKYGNTYTIWSASTATAIPPLSVRLNPGDNIIVTYTTVPTWTWVPA